MRPLSERFSSSFGSYFWLTVEKLEQLFHSQIDPGKEGHDGHRGLHAALDISLGFASKTDRDDNDNEGRDYCFKRLHRGLCVLQKQGTSGDAIMSVECEGGEGGVGSEHDAEPECM